MSERWKNLFDPTPWPRVIWHYPVLFLAAILLGAICAFAYSYAPLHRAKDWQIGYLEERIELRSSQVEELERGLEEAEKSLVGQPSGEELSAVRAQLAEATKLAESRDRELETLDGKLKSVTRSRDSWKSRHAEARAALDERNAEPARAEEPLAAPGSDALAEAPAAGPPSPSGDDASAAPAAPAGPPPLD